MATPDPLSTLTWLVEAGADEAIGETPVNRLAVREAPAHKAPSAAPTSSRTVPAPANLSRDEIGSAMDIAARCGSLAELKAALEAFDLCALKRLATNTVFADGNPSSRIMLIGEAPGRDEDRIGLPFVGRAGKLLDKMLASIHLDRSCAYITNVLPWRPPDNRNPEPSEVGVCMPFLRRHIELIDPGVLILIGAVSVKSVMGLNEGIMKTRGRWLEYRVGEKMIPVMPTLHPAYLLRRPVDKRLVWRDLQLVELKLAELGLPAATSRAN